jgi:hypothetical protein
LYETVLPDCISSTVLNTTSTLAPWKAVIWVERPDGWELAKYPQKKRAKKKKKKKNDAFY